MCSESVAGVGLVHVYTEMRMEVIYYGNYTATFPLDVITLWKKRSYRVRHAHIHKQNNCFATKPLLRTVTWGCSVHYSHF